MNANEMRALELVKSNPRQLLEAGHAVLNAAIADLLRAKLVDYAPERAIGYRLTFMGIAALDRGLRYFPTTLFIPGTNIRTNVHHWEVRSGRVWVEYLDGLRVRSELTPSELAKQPGVALCTCGDGASRDCLAHGDGN